MISARVFIPVHAAEPSVVALEVTANGTRVIPTNPLGMLFGASDGLIVTDDHVVHGAQHINVLFKNGDRVAAHVYGEDPVTDIALACSSPASRTTSVPRSTITSPSSTSGATASPRRRPCT